MEFPSNTPDGTTAPGDTVPGDPVPSDPVPSDAGFDSDLQQADDVSTEALVAQALTPTMSTEPPPPPPKHPLSSPRPECLP